MARRTLRVGLIGQGFMGRVHSNAFRQVTHFFDVPFEIDCAVICGRDTGRLARMASTWGWRETATDWRALVQREDIDLIDIAVPNALHAPIAIAAAEAGKIVLCEKPLATSLEDAIRMADAARAVPTMVWFNYRRVPAIAFARQLIEDGRLGQVFHYRATYLQQSGPDTSRRNTWKMKKSEAGSGALGDLLSHLVDVSLHLNGPIAEVSALMRTFMPEREIDDAALALARFENGSIGTFEATRYGIGCRNRNAFEIHGERGMLGFDLEDMNRLQFVDATQPPGEQGPRNLLVTGPGHPYSENFWKPGHIIGYEHTFIAALGDFLKALERGERFQPDFGDGVRVQRVLDAVERSAGAGRWVRAS